MQKFTKIFPGILLAVKMAFDPSFYDVQVYDQRKSSIKLHVGL